MTCDSPFTSASTKNIVSASVANTPLFIENPFPLLVSFLIYVTGNVCTILSVSSVEPSSTTIISANKPDKTSVLKTAPMRDDSLYAGTMAAIFSGLVC